MLVSGPRVPRDDVTATASTYKPTLLARQAVMSRGVRVSSYLSHEEGDQRTIPEVFFDHALMLNPQLSHDELPRLHHALTVSGQKRQAGHNPVNKCVGATQCGEEEERGRVEEEGGGRDLLSMEGRLGTFPRDWPGPPGRRMAEAGLYRMAHCDAKVACAFCPVQFRTREWDRLDDPWERHVTLSANCPYVRRTKDMGNRRLRHSTTSIHILGGH
ncbi:hypothetical protein ACOMHN_049589 [Nucella lapillus]